MKVEKLRVFNHLIYTSHLWLVLIDILIENSLQSIAKIHEV